MIKSIALGLVALITGLFNPPLRVHKVNYFDPQSFYSGVSQSAQTPVEFEDHIYGGIVPHHLVPGFIITDFFSRLQKQSPKTVILIGPNHYERGEHPASISEYAWDTQFGKVLPQIEVISKLKSSGAVFIDESVLPADHAVSGIIPFVKYYLPDARVVPILLSGFMSERDISNLSVNLAQVMDHDTVLIAAVDFSHNLTSPEAQAKDKITYALMQSGNYGKILNLNNEYLDSPASVVTLLMTVNTLGKTKVQELHHTDSGQLQKNNSIPTTSYFSLAFY
jgi:MEMO1 family protein